MSVRLIADLLNREYGNVTIRMLLIALAGHANDDGSSVYPSVSTLALEAGISPDTVRRSIKVLKRDGLLELVGKKPCRYGHTHEYRLNLSAIRALPVIARVRARHEPAPRTALPLVQCDPSQLAGPRTAPPNPSQDASQPCQESTPSSSGWREHPWMKRIFEVAGPGLADPAKDYRVTNDLIARIPRWEDAGWSIEDDILPVVRMRTVKARASPMFNFRFIEDDIAAHRARRQQPVPVVEISHGQPRPFHAAGRAGARSGSQFERPSVVAALARLRTVRENADEVFDRPKDGSNDGLV